MVFDSYVQVILYLSMALQYMKKKTIREKFKIFYLETKTTFSSTGNEGKKYAKSTIIKMIK